MAAGKTQSSNVKTNRINNKIVFGTHREVETND